MLQRRGGRDPIATPGNVSLMLTVDFVRLSVGAGDRVLDSGCGFGRHAYECVRRGAHVVAIDAGGTEVHDVRDMLAAMAMEKEFDSAVTHGQAVCGDVLALPFADACFDRIICSEVLEHLPDDSSAMAELARVLRPGGTMAVTVPRAVPERINWWLSTAYYSVPGGHVRIYKRRTLEARLRAAGLVVTGHHYAHALHSPYWWLKCLVGTTNDRNWVVRGYHRLLVWDIVRRPRLTRWAEVLLNPLIGKSLVVYVEKPQ